MGNFFFPSYLEIPDNHLITKIISWIGGFISLCGIIALTTILINGYYRSEKIDYIQDSQPGIHDKIIITCKYSIECYIHYHYTSKNCIQYNLDHEDIYLKQNESIELDLCKDDQQQIDLLYGLPIGFNIENLDRMMSLDLPGYHIDYQFSGELMGWRKMFISRYNVINDITGNESVSYGGRLEYFHKNRFLFPDVCQSKYNLSSSKLNCIWIEVQYENELITKKISRGQDLYSLVAQIFGGSSGIITVVGFNVKTIKKFIRKKYGNYDKTNINKIEQEIKDIQNTEESINIGIIDQFVDSIETINI